MRFIMSTILCPAVVLFGLTAGVAEQLAGRFEYDAKKPFDTVCEQLEPRNDAVVQGCRFTGPRGGTISFILVNPKTAKPPFTGVIFQHGGRQSMTNYLSEALILAQVGVISVLPDVPARGEGKKSEINTMKLPDCCRFSGRNRDFRAARPRLPAATARCRSKAYRLCRSQLRWNSGWGASRN